jgi:hypothetical protein
MGRTRTKTKKSVPTVTEPPADKATPSPPISSLLEKAQSLIDQCDYDLARRFVERILERASAHGEARELLGIIQLETGELEAAKKVSP